MCAEARLMEYHKLDVLPESLKGTLKRWLKGL